MENKNKLIIWWNNISDIIENKNCDDTYKLNTNPSSGDDGPNCEVHGLCPPSLGAPMVSILKYWNTGCAELCTLFFGGRKGLPRAV